ncbi:MAG TPA: polymer-forming cytoskeletal protein [Lachnospiraceae bacterium]|nr:polymer-forming cytoskeletal protein [Lachnospiraceae bacterium]
MARKTNESNSQKINSIIGLDTLFEGNITTKEITRVDGIIKGNVTSEGTLIVGPKGKVEGNINATNVIIGGIIEGDLKATGKVEITSTGSIKGDITTKSLIIDENAVFQGTCSMNAEVVKKATTTKNDDIKTEELIVEE